MHHDFLSLELFCQLEDVDFFFFIPSKGRKKSINYPAGTSNSIWESYVVSKKKWDVWMSF